MSWITLTPDDLERSLTALERDIFGKTATDGDPTDRSLEIINDAVALLRGCIASFSGNVLTEDENMIPRMGVHHCLAIARWRLLSSLPKYAPGEARKVEYDEALKFLDKLAEGKIKAPKPIGYQEASEAPADALARPSITSRPRRYNRQDGI